MLDPEAEPFELHHTQALFTAPEPPSSELPATPLLPKPHTNNNHLLLHPCIPYLLQKPCTYITYLRLHTLHTYLLLKTHTICHVPEHNTPILHYAGVDSVGFEGHTMGLPCVSLQAHSSPACTPPRLSQNRIGSNPNPGPTIPDCAASPSPHKGTDTSLRD